MRSLLALGLPLALAHLCLLNPVQRLGFNVSDGGDPSCYQPLPPCGDTVGAAPKMTIPGGQALNVFVQQNLNHYNPGARWWLADATQR